MDGFIKIGDFGLVTDVTPDIYNLNNGDKIAYDKVDSKSMRNNRRRSDKTHTNQVGTQLYMSPEQISGEKYSSKVDIFSLGVIFCEMLLPFSTEMERIQVLTKIKTCSFPTYFKTNHPDEVS